MLRLSLLFLLTLSPLASYAQAVRPAPLSPFVGFALGVSDIPEVVQGCSPEQRIGADARAGFVRGNFGVELRGGVLGEVGIEDCGVEDPYVPPDGIHTQRLYPFERGDMHAAVDLRLRYGGTLGLPLLVAVGAGWLTPVAAPALLVGTGFRSRGRIRMALDVERTWFRIPQDVVTREWRERRVVREISRERDYDWHPGLNVRVGLEFGLR
jgi:hypothetical protein